MRTLWDILVWFLAVFSPPVEAEWARCAACVTAAYSIQARGVDPAPSPPSPEPKPNPNPVGCVSGCSCQGTGWVKTPEGFRIPCPCPPECRCKKAERGDQ